MAVTTERPEIVQQVNLKDPRRFGIPSSLPREYGLLYLLYAFGGMTERQIDRISQELLKDSQRPLEGIRTLEEVSKSAQFLPNDRLHKIKRAILGKDPFLAQVAVRYNSAEPSTISAKAGNESAENPVFSAMLYELRDLCAVGEVTALRDTPNGETVFAPTLEGHEVDMALRILMQHSELGRKHVLVLGEYQSGVLNRSAA